MPTSRPLPHDTSALLERLPSRLCVSILGASTAEMQARSAVHLPSLPLQEFRLDTLHDPAAAPALLQPHVAAHSDAVFLATCRPKRSGGLWEASGSAEAAVLEAAAEAGFHLVDLSLESAEELGPGALDRLRDRGARVLVSYHHFDGTGDLPAVLARLRRLGPDLCKIVPTAKTLRDSLAVIELLREARQEGGPAVIALAMGEEGVLTRLLSLREGCPFTFAAASAEQASAPGQLTAQMLRDVYRVDALGPASLLFGVAGDPIHSSLSPLMLNAAFQAVGIPAIDMPLKTRDAEELLHLAAALPLAGCSLTMPLKEQILPLLQAVDPMALRIGAVNTLRRRADGGYEGFNTDAAGIVGPLERRLSLRGARVLVLGAGGAARAAVFGCVDRGASVFVSNRSRERAAALAREAAAQVLDQQEVPFRDFDILIHATPAGMRSHPRSLPVEPHRLRARVVFDLVYNPMDTPLLAMAREQGAETIAGVEMFIHQGARQFELWTGQGAQVELMQRVVLEALRRR